MAMGITKRFTNAAAHPYMNINTPQHVISMFRLNRSMKLAPITAQVPDAGTLPVFMSKITSRLLMPTTKSMAGRKYDTPP
jgi:hypothetical protein